MRKYLFCVAIFLIVSLFTTNVFAQNRIIKNKTYLKEINESVYYILIKPRNYRSSQKYPLFIFMHSRGSSADYILKDDYSLLTKQNFYILIPQAPTKYNDGFSWYNLKDNNQFVKDLEKSEYVITGTTQHINKRHNIDSSRVVLSGFSQGGRLCFYIGFRNPELFSEIIPVGGSYTGNILNPYTNNIKNLKISIFHGTHDSVNSFTRMQNAYQKLKKKGLNVSLNTYPLGHTYTTEILKTILERVK